MKLCYELHEGLNAPLYLSDLSDAEVRLSLTDLRIQTLIQLYSQPHLAVPASKIVSRRALSIMASKISQKLRQSNALRVFANRHRPWNPKLRLPTYSAGSTNLEIIKVRTKVPTVCYLIGSFSQFKSRWAQRLISTLTQTQTLTFPLLHLVQHLHNVPHRIHVLLRH